MVEVDTMSANAHVEVWLSAWRSWLDAGTSSDPGLLAKFRRDQRSTGTRHGDKELRNTCLNAVASLFLLLPSRAWSLARQWPQTSNRMIK